MAEITSKIDSVKWMRHTTLRVELTRYKELRVRLWLGEKLISLAAWVMNCGIKFEDTDSA